MKSSINHLYNGIGMTCLYDMHVQDLNFIFITDVCSFCHLCEFELF